MAVTSVATVAAAPFVPRQAQQTAAVGGACPTTVPRRLRAARAPPRRARQFVAVQAASDLGFVDSAVGAALLDWVLDNEGHVHPGLRVVEDAPCGGGRGVIATEAISAEDSANVPLLLVPDALYMTSQVARVGMGYYEERGAPPLGELDNATQLATLLAHEAAEGADSFYHPYIAALPSAAPNGWALGDAAMDASLAALAAGAGAGHAGQLEEWAAEARRTRATLESHCDALHQRHAKYFRSEVTPETYFWAMGMVLSRAFSSHPQLGLAPLIDSMNHRAGADHPEPVRVNGEEEDDTYFYVTAARDGFPAALAAGDELCIRYVDAGTSPKDAWLSYGFVPPELWTPGAAQPN
mmetsp:Transcript_1208/g.2885  ORF Transcript_1208/g.2885 Transcript_1208/m.2885 type:complete len:353 (-) Transcript_1208:17-1075(-)